MKKHRSASGITAFNSMIYAAGGHDGYRIFDTGNALCFSLNLKHYKFIYFFSFYLFKLKFTILKKMNGHLWPQ
jgi:hypothetical protein